MKRNCIFLIIVSLFLSGCENQAFNKARSSNTVEAYNEFLQSYPSSEHTPIVNDLKDEAFFHGCKRIIDLEKSKNCFINYLSEFQKGKYKVQSKQAIEELMYKICIKNNTLRSLRPYLQKYPYGKYAENIRQKMDIIQNKYKGIMSELDYNIYTDVYKAVDAIDKFNYRLREEISYISKDKYETSDEYNKRVKEHEKNFTQNKEKIIEKISFLLDKEYIVEDIAIQFEYDADREFASNIEILCSGNTRLSIRRFPYLFCEIGLVEKDKEKNLDILFIDRIIKTKIITSRVIERQLSRDYISHDLLIDKAIRIDRLKAKQYEDSLRARIKIEIYPLIYNKSKCPEDIFYTLKSVEIYSY